MYVPFLIAFLARQPQRLLPLPLLIFQPLLADLVHVAFISQFRQRLLAQMMSFNDLLLLRLDLLLQPLQFFLPGHEVGVRRRPELQRLRFSTSMKFFFLGV